MVGFAADQEVMAIINRYVAQYGDISKAIRALIFQGSPEDGHRKVLELESTIEDLQHQVAAAKAALEQAYNHMDTATVIAEVKKPVKAIDFSLFPEAIRDQLKSQWAAKHPEAANEPF